MDDGDDETVGDVVVGVDGDGAAVGNFVGEIDGNPVEGGSDGL
jgi:hypothetical protein